MITPWTGEWSNVPFNTTLPNLKQSNHQHTFFFFICFAAVAITTLLSQM